MPEPHVDPVSAAVLLEDVNEKLNRILAILERLHPSILRPTDAELFAELQLETDT